MKGKRKIALSTLMACLIVGNIGYANEVDYDVLKDTVNAGYVAGSSNMDFTDSVYNYEKDASGRVYGIFATDEKIANVSNENIYITVSNNNINGDTYGVAAAILKSGNDFTHGGTVNLGTDATKNINIRVNASGYATGITAMRHINNADAKPAFVNVKGENLIIDVHSDNTTAAGIWAQNNTGDPSNPSTVTINTENTHITATSGNNDSVGIVAMSSSKVVVDSNLYIDAANAILARGNSTVKINENGNRTTQLNGNINFNYDEKTSGTTVDANVIVNLTGADSYWNGNAVISWGTGSIPDNKDEVSGMDLTVADGAQWNPEYIDESDEGDSGVTAVALNNLTLNDGVVNLDKMDGQALEVENLGGSGGIVNTNSLENKMTIDTADAGTSITVNGSGEIADAIYGGSAKAQDLADVVTSGDKSAADKITTDEGVIAGRITADVNEDGEITNTVYAKNTTNVGLSNMASINLMTWRQENNDMNKRLGELRDSKGEHGVWARMVRGEVEYESIKNQYNYYQVGYDEKLSTDPNWTVGMFLTRTEGSSSFNTGSAENNHTGVGVYGSYLKDDGSFIDLVAKYARIDSDFTANGGVGSGDYNTNGYSISAEYGKRFEQGNGFWIEPQVELTYGTVGAVEYMTSSGSEVRQEGMDSLVGRVGFSLGKDIKAGNVYARASYLYDFDGETEVTMSNGGISDVYEQDLGGGWFEVGLGTNINLSEATHLYFDVEKTYGGDVATPWQWSAGVRYSF